MVVGGRGWAVFLLLAAGSWKSPLGAWGGGTHGGPEVHKSARGVGRYCPFQGTVYGANGWNLKGCRPEMYESLCKTRGVL